MELATPLYHYTSQEGLLGILRTNKLRMTNILYLNDSSEFIHMFNLVREELYKRHKISKLFSDKQIDSLASIPDNELSTNELVCKLYTRFEDFTQKKTIDLGEDYFVFSLSEEKDDLSQWRGYCPLTGGFCIEFDRKKLSFLVEKKGSKLEKVIYDKKRKEEIIKELISNNMHVKIGTEKELWKLVRIVLLSASLLKDESFKNEKEWRIIYDIFTDKGPAIDFREGRSMITPFVEVKFTDENEIMPINRIFVGPTPHRELSKKSVELLIRSQGRTIDVECSPIPYRSW